MSGPGLLKDLDAVFENSEQRVLAAFVAIKCEPRPSGARSRRALPKPTGKTRIICLTVKRRSKKRGFKGTLHICKPWQGRYQVRKSIKLKLLSRMEAFVDSPGQQEYLELAFVQRGFTGGETRLAFEVQGAATRLQLLGTLYTFCRAHEKRAPQVVGIDVAELESSTALHGKQTDTDVGQTARSLLVGPGREDDSGELAAAALAGSDGDEAGGGGHPLWGQREDQQIQSLLEMVSVGAASMEELKERLEAELAALEDASVHEMLEAGPVVARVLGGLGGAARLLEDLGETLDIFDARLRHMREDIAAIEGRNNQLERHSRNNQQLLAALEGLVERLSLPPEVERALTAPDINAANMEAAVAAGWDLHSRLQALSEGGAAAAAAGDDGRLPGGIAGMAAVAVQRQRLHSLQRSFVDRAAACLQAQLARVAEVATQQVAGLQGAARLRPPPHANVRRRAAALAPLLQLVGALRPAATVAPREAYCQAVAGLLRAEMHGAVAELRRMAAAAEAAGLQEPDLLAPAKPAAAIDPASSRDRSFTLAPAQSQARMAAAPSTASIPARYREAGILTLHEGFQLLLDHLVPLMEEEAAQCIALIFPRATGSGRSDSESASGAAAPAPAASKAVRFAGGEPGPAPAPPPADVGGKEVQGTVASLLSGLDGELAGAVEGVRGGATLLCLPMLGATLAWRQRVAAKGAACRPVVALLEGCERRLSALLEAHFEQRAAAVQRFDPRGHHILPCVLNLPLVAARVEQLLQPWPVEQAPPAAAATQQQPDATPSSKAEAAGRPPLPPSATPPAAGQAPPLFLSPFESGGGGRAAPPPWRAAASSGSASELSGVSAAEEGLSSDLSYMTSEAGASSRRTTTATSDAEAAAGAAAGAPVPTQQPGTGSQQQQQQQAEQQEQQSPGAVLRALADAGYDAWLRAVLAAVEAHAAADPKHGQQLRLENYAALLEGLQGLPVSGASVLGGWAGQVAALRDGARGLYIEEQAEYFRFSRVLEFSRRLDEAMASAGSAEVHLQQQFAPGEVRALLAATTAGLDKKLAQVYQRILKHLAATSPHLVDQVWDRLERICLERWTRMEEQLRQCYSGIELRPPPAELRRWFRAAKAAGA